MTQEETRKEQKNTEGGPWYMKHSFTNGGATAAKSTPPPLQGPNGSGGRQELEREENLHGADEEVLKILSYEGEGDARGQAIVPSLGPAESAEPSGGMKKKKGWVAPPPLPPGGKITAVTSSTSSGVEEGQPPPASSSSSVSLTWEERVQKHLDAMDFEQHLPSYEINEETAVEMTPEFLHRFFLAVDQGDAAQVFGMVAVPEHQRTRWAAYSRDLMTQLREEEREKLEEEERKHVAEKKGETYFKKPVYIKKAKKPWEAENIDEATFIPVKRGLDLNVRDPAEFNSTALHKAVRKMRMDCVTLLTRCEQCDVNLANDFGETPLHFSVKNGHVQSTFVLLKRNARIDVRDKAYDSPMSLGIKLARDGCCKLLVEFGADVSELYDRNLVRVRKMNLENDEDGASLEGIEFDPFGFPVDKSRNTPDADSTANQWKSMLSNMIKKGKLDKSLKKKIRKGVPGRVRGALWKTFLPIENLKKENIGVYNRLLEKPSNFSKQIDLDINRTFREHRDFKERYGACQIKLFNILKAYSLFNPEVGYTQGMSSLTAFFLMYLPQEEDTFWMLVHVLRDPIYDLQSIFLPGFPRLYECFFVHEHLLQKTLPSLSSHFDKEGISTSMYGTKWYMLLMMDILPFSTVVRLWDIFLFEGNKVIFNVILSVFRILEPQMLGMDFEQIMTFLGGLDQVEINPERLIMLATEKKVKHKYIKEFEKQYRRENPDRQPQSSQGADKGKRKR